MDSITTAILTAILAGAAAGSTKVCEQTIVDAYIKLKGLLKQKFGIKGEVIKAVKALEDKPNSAARREVVAEELKAVAADQDTELSRTADELLDIIKAKPDGSLAVQSAIGNHNVQIAGVGHIVKSRNSGNV